jgi:dihydroxyacetone kinase-like protein
VIYVKGDLLIRFIDVDTLIVIIKDMASAVVENENYLTELDSAIGDGDHGVNLRRGFDALAERLPSFKEKEIHELLNDAGLVLLETTGGSVGALYGSAIMEAGKTMRDKDKIFLNDFVRMVQAAEGAIRNRGQVQVGEKTMLDTIHPFLESLRKSLEEDLTFIDALDRGHEAAKEGLESTRNMIAKKGRAKYLGEKTLGHLDVGAASSYLMIQSLLKTMKKIDRDHS